MTLAGGDDLPCDAASGPILSFLAIQSLCVELPVFARPFKRCLASAKGSKS